MKSRFFVAAACVALIVGCSSESERYCSFAGCEITGGTGGTGGVGGSGLVDVNTDTALLVLREAWHAASASADVPGLVVATGIGDTSGGTAFFGTKTTPVFHKSLVTNTVFVDPFGPTTYNCPVSGQFIVSGDVTDPLTVTAGDFFIYDSTACDSGTGYTVDGEHRLDISNIDGDPMSGQFEQTQLLTFTDFIAASATLTTRLTGDHTSVIDTRPVGAVTMSFSGNSLSIFEGSTLIIDNYGGFVSASTISPFNASLDLSGTGNSSETQGSFIYFTNETWQQVPGEDPTDGFFNVEGLNRSTARIAVDDVIGGVRIQVDANASGNYESTTDMTWPEFLAGTVPLTAAEFEAD